MTEAINILNYLTVKDTPFILNLQPHETPTLNFPGKGEQKLFKTTKLSIKSVLFPPYTGLITKAKTTSLKLSFSTRVDTHTCIYPDATVI